MARIFISHSSKDNETASWLKDWLTEKGFEQTFLDFDKDSGIQPGAEWEKTLYRELERAQAVIIVVTANWHASKWCFAEITHARAQGKIIFPLIVAPTGEKIIGEDLQNIDLLSDREGGLTRLGNALTQIAMQSPEGFELAKGIGPFPGLSAFEERHAAVFYGRDPEIRKALERLRRCRTISNERLMVLLGASGSGKSSLLRAGLIPRLKRDRENWIVCPPFRPEADPLNRLIDILMMTVFGQGKNLSEADKEQEGAWRTALYSSAPQKALVEISRELRRRQGAMDAFILLPIDQMEELFTNAAPEDTKAFFTFLTRMLDEKLPFVAIAALRSDFLGDMQKADGLPIAYDLFPLDPMPLERIGTLVRSPAHLVDLKVEEELIAALVHDAQSEDALPLIAFLLRRLFEQFGKDRHWDLSHYESLGDRTKNLSPLENAISLTAEEALPKLSAKEAHNLREAFVPALVRINASGAYVRRSALLSSLDEKARPLIQKLVTARLLVTHSRQEADEDDSHAIDPTVEVAHEALFRVWPRLADWLEEEREFLIGKARLEQHLADWQALPKTEKAKALLTGVMLERARSWIIAHPARFNSQDERRFIQLSEAAEAAEGRRRDRMRRRLFSAMGAAVIILIAGVAVSTYFFFAQRDQTRIAAEEAERANAALKAATETANGLVFDLAQKFRDSGLPNAIVVDILKEARKLQDKLITDNQDNTTLQRGRVVALTELSLSLTDFGDPTGALEAAEESLKIIQKLSADEPENTLFQRDLSVSLNNVADIKRRYDPEAALALYQQTLDMRRTLAKAEPANTQYQRDLYVSLDNIADIKLRTDPGAALVLYQQVLVISRAIAEAEPTNTRFQRDLSVSLNKIALIKRRNDPKAALALYQQTLDIRRTLAKAEPTNTQFQQDLSFSLNNVADIKLRTDTGAALALYQQSLDIRRTLAKAEPTNTKFHRGLSVSLDNVADIKLRTDPGAALVLYQQVLDIRRALAKAEPTNTQLQVDIVVNLYKIATVTKGDQRKQALEEALDILMKLEKEDRLTAGQKAWPATLRNMLKQDDK